MTATLEDKFKDEVGRDISISLGDYDRKNFVSAMDDLTDLQEYFSALQQNQGDVGAMNDIAGLLAPENPNILLRMAVKDIARAADVTLSKANLAMAKYAEKNDFYKELNAEQLLAILLQLANPKLGLVFKHRENEAHNKLVDIVKRQAAIQIQDQEAISRGIGEMMKKAPAWHADMFARYNHDQSYMAALADSYAGAVGMVFTETFYDINGKQKIAKEDLITKFYEDNREIVTDEIDEVEKSGNKKVAFKLWDKNLKPAHLYEAKTLYGKEKPEQKKEDNEDFEKEKAERKSLGLKE